MGRPSIVQRWEITRSSRGIWVRWIPQSICSRWTPHLESTRRSRRASKAHQASRGWLLSPALMPAPSRPSLITGPGRFGHERRCVPPPLFVLTALPVLPPESAPDWLHRPKISSCRRFAFPLATACASSAAAKPHAHYRPDSFAVLAKKRVSIPRICRFSRAFP